MSTAKRTANRARASLAQATPVPSAPAGERLLRGVGARVRSERERHGWPRKVLAERSGVSERFLAQLETGRGNISLVRFAEVATALGVHPTDLWPPAGDGPLRPIALLGVRGAGKSTLAQALGTRLGVPVVELDREVERAAGLGMGELLELHGEAYYRRLEREVLLQLTSAPRPLVIATGGSIVNDAVTYRVLRERCTTIWLRAPAEEHWRRVIQQGDQRPMRKNPHAFAELEALLAARAPRYALAAHTLDTTGLDAAQTLTRALAALDLSPPRPR